MPESPADLPTVPDAADAREIWEAPALTVIKTAAHTKGADPRTSTTESFGYTLVS